MPSFEIHPLDLQFLGRPEGIASYLVLGPGGPALVETGPGSTLETLKSELARFNLQPGDIRDVLVTHIHLDHAGASGWWARQGATIHVHHVGAPHLIDPSKLLASAQRIYGDTMKPLWGEFLASPAERVRALRDGDVAQAAGLKFIALDTPGHARHHLVYRLEDIAFAGDLAGIRLAGRPHLRLPTPPPEFDREAWQASIRRARAEKFARLYLTHFGPVDDVDSHWENTIALVGEYAERVKRELDAGADREAIVARFSAWEEAQQTAHGLDEAARELYAGVGPMRMSVDGIVRYWEKALTPSPSPPSPLSQRERGRG